MTESPRAPWRVRRLAAPFGSILLAAVLGTPLVGPGLHGQETEPNEVEDPTTLPRPTTHAVRTSGQITIDGRRDESAWSQAPAISQFIQAKPHPGRPATEATDVRLLYDEEFLYISAICYDSSPGEEVANTLERDSNTLDTDVFGVALDTFRDRRNSFAFFINPRGAVRDGQTFNDSRTSNFSWNAVMSVETLMREDGWSVEMAIPWNTLRFDPSQEDQIWGVNFLRRARRKSEDSYWAPLGRHEVLYTMSSAGTLLGLRGIAPGRNLKVKPYVIGSQSKGVRLSDGQDGRDFDRGIDAKYGLTTGLTLDLTYNTDFSQVEVDQERVNLTRFSLFFPEKRDFFLENSGIFDFGDVTERGYRMGASLGDFTLFHSRRIGLTQSGHPLPIRGGGRVSGSVGDFEVGLLSMHTRTSDLAPEESFTVARLKRKILGTSDVGLMFVNRMSSDGSSTFNRSYGADANVRFLGDLVVHSYVVRTDGPGDAGDGTAGRISAAYRDALWDVSAFYKTVGEAFTPGVGFIRRRGMHHSYATVGAHPQPSWSFIQEVNPYAEIDYITDPSSRLDTRRVAGGLGVEFIDGSLLTLERSDRFERILEPFQVASEATVPEGVYSFAENTLDLQTSRARDVAATVGVTVGDFFQGTRRSVALATFLRPSYHMTVELRGERNLIDLASQSTTADVFGARVNYAASTRLYANAFVQYNASTRQMITNLRLDFLHAPLSDLFLVYTERRDLENSAVLERTVSAKVTRMVSF